MTLSQSSLDVAQWLLATSETALATCGRDPINRAYVAAGQIAWDDCCGMLVVAPERIYQSETFPQPNPNQEYCFGGYLAVEYVVLLVRCTPTVDDRGRAPSEAELQSAYDSLLGDAAIVYNALNTQMPSDWIRTVPVQTFVGAQGGCIGVETRVIVGIEQNQWAICCAEPTPHVPGDPICQIPASLVRFEPCDDLSSTNVQDAICELAALVEEGVPGPPGPPGPQGDPGPPGPPGPPAPSYYGSFLSNVDQVTTVATDTAMTVNITDLSSGVSVVSGSRVTIANAGVYDLQFSAQLHHRGGGGSGEQIDIWLAKNGTPVPLSNTRLIVPNSRYLVAAWDFLLSASAGDYYELFWRTDNHNLVIEHLPAVGSVPETPSLIVTVMQVA